MTVTASASPVTPDFAPSITLREVGEPAHTVTHTEPGLFIRRSKAYWHDGNAPSCVVEVHVTEARDAPGVAYALEFVVGTGPGLVDGTTILSHGIGAGYAGAFKVLISGRLMDVVPRESDLYLGVRLVLSGDGGRLNLSARLSEVRA